MRIGVDLGGTSIKAGIVNNHGIIISQNSVKTSKGKDNHGNDKICIDIINLIDELIEKNNTSIETIESIGLGVPGNVDYENGIVGKCVNLNWEQVHIVDILKNQFGKSVFVDNDANVAVAAEYLFGSGKDSSSMAMLTLGTGVGGGAILNGKMYRGKNGTALEIGHMIVGDNFYNCSCGNNGCLETFASATAIIKYTKKLMEINKNTIIMEKVNGDLKNIDAKIVFDAARERDPLAIKVLQRFIKYLAIGVNNLINILDVDSIAIGGGVSAGADLFMDELIEEVTKIKLFKDVPLCRINKAILGNEAGIIGAAMIDKI